MLGNRESGWLKLTKSPPASSIQTKEVIVALECCETQGDGRSGGQEKGLAGRLDKAGWGLFFIWIAIAFVADVGDGVGLLGVAVIVLGGQVARKSMGVPLEGFWLVVGVLFLLGALWELYSVELPLVPIVLGLAGIVLVLSAIGVFAKSESDD